MPSVADASFDCWGADMDASGKGANNKWTEPLALGGEIHVLGFNSMQPFVTKDGKYLIFASDRPGGSGKYDLWYATLRADGSSGNAINLGDRINSSGDDGLSNR